MSRNFDLVVIGTGTGTAAMAAGRASAGCSVRCRNNKAQARFEEVERKLERK